MTIFQDIHTYLIASFALMLLLIYKKAYKNIDQNINDGISQIEQEINNLKTQKTKLTKKLGELNTQLKFETDMSCKTIEEAHEKAADLAKQLKIANQQEIEEIKSRYQNTYQKLQENINIELQQEINILIINKIKIKLKKLTNNASFQYSLTSMLLDPTVPAAGRRS